MPTNTNQQIESKVQAFVQELSGLVRIAALEAVAAALGERAAGTARRGRPKGSKNKATRMAPRASRGGKRAKRTPEQVEQMGARVVDHVKKNPGQGVEGIAKALKVPSKELQLPIIRMLAAKKLRTTGQRRGTKYFVK